MELTCRVAVISRQDITSLNDQSKRWVKSKYQDLLLKLENLKEQHGLISIYPWIDKKPLDSGNRICRIAVEQEPCQVRDTPTKYTSNIATSFQEFVFGASILVFEEISGVRVAKIFTLEGDLFSEGAIKRESSDEGILKTKYIFPSDHRDPIFLVTLDSTSLFKIVKYQFRYNATSGIVYITEQILFSEKMPQQINRLAKWLGPELQHFAGAARIVIQQHAEFSQ